MITPHFTLDEVTARWRKGVLVPGADRDALLALEPSARDHRMDALHRVCLVAEAIREQVGKPIHVTSGYRHGDPNQHGQGEALDLQVRGVSPLELLRIVRGLALPVRLRQVIAESMHQGRESLDGTMEQGSGRWLHVAVFSVGPMATFDRASSLPWSCSWAPSPGSRRQYVAV